jgi:hypothetical protein
VQVWPGGAAGARPDVTGWAGAGAGDPPRAANRVFSWRTDVRMYTCSWAPSCSGGRAWRGAAPRATGVVTSRSPGGASVDCIALQMYVCTCPRRAGRSRRRGAVAIPSVSYKCTYVRGRGALASCGEGGHEGLGQRGSAGLGVQVVPCSPALRWAGSRKPGRQAARCPSRVHPNHMYICTSGAPRGFRRLAGGRLAGIFARDSGGLSWLSARTATCSSPAGAT